MPSQLSSSFGIFDFTDVRENVCVALLNPNLPQGRNAPWTDLLILCNSTFSSCRAERKYAHDYVWFQKGFFKVFFHKVTQYLRVCNSMFLTRLDKCKYHPV